jgi:hypothetical protein
MIKIVGIGHNRDYSMQHSDVYWNDVFLFNMVDIFPRFYGAGGVFDCALSGKPQPKHRERIWYGSFSAEEVDAALVKYGHLNAEKIDSPYGDDFCLQFNSVKKFIMFLSDYEGRDLSGFLAEWEQEKGEVFS